MCRFANTQCQDPRALIAAVVGLWPATRSRVDYAASVEVNYIAFAQEMVNDGRALDVLECATRCQQQQQPNLFHLPAWVPDWSRLDTTADRDHQGGT